MKSVTLTQFLYFETYILSELHNSNVNFLSARLSFNGINFITLICTVIFLESIMKKRIDKIMEGLHLRRDVINTRNEQIINDEESNQPRENIEIEIGVKNTLEIVNQYEEENALKKDDQYKENISNESQGKETVLSPGFLDFSSGSSDDYIPNSESDSTETSTSTSRPKKRCKRSNNLIIAESSDDPDISITEPEPGCSNSNKKQRK